MVVEEAYGEEDGENEEDLEGAGLKKGLPMVMIFVIIAVVIMVIALVIVLIIKKRKP